MYYKQNKIYFDLSPVINSYNIPLEPGVKNKFCRHLPFKSHTVNKNVPHAAVGLTKKVVDNKWFENGLY